MKIGILTLPLHVNYGGILQAYALQTVLEKMGHDVIVIDQSVKHKNNIYSAKIVIRILYRIVKKIILRKQCVIFREKFEKEAEPYVNLNGFISSHIHTIKLESPILIKENQFDAIVVGSDQIWRPLYCHEIEHAYLDFTENWDIKRISYAASFGVDNWEYTEDQTVKCSKLLKKFNAVSVREKSGVELCKKYMEVDARHVLDPTLLLTADEYSEIAGERKEDESEKFIAVYILTMTSDKQKVVNEISSRMHLKCRYLKKQVKEILSIQDIIPYSVDYWLRSMRDAEFVITDSFHACVFSIINHKEFFIYGNNSGGLSRFESLLDDFKIKGRYITNSHQLILPLPSLDYNDIDSILTQRKEYSINFIESSLNG